MCNLTRVFCVCSPCLQHGLWTCLQHGLWTCLQHGLWTYNAVKQRADCEIGSCWSGLGCQVGVKVTCSRVDCARDEQGVCKDLLCMAVGPGMLAALCGVLAAGKLFCGVPAKPSPADQMSA